MAYLISHNLNSEEKTVFENFKKLVPEYNHIVYHMVYSMGQKVIDIPRHEWNLMTAIIQKTHEEIFTKDSTLFTHVGSNAEEREKLLPWIKEGMKDMNFDELRQNPEYEVTKEASAVIAYLLSRFQQENYWSSGSYSLDVTVDGVQYSISTSDNVVRTDEAMTLKWWMVRMQIARFCMFFEGRHGFTVITPKKVVK